MTKFLKFKSINLLAAVVLSLLFCTNFSFAKVAGKVGKGPKKFQLVIAHSSDNESSFQDPNTLEPKILNYSTIVKGLQTLAKKENRAFLHLTAGDHTIPGPFYQAAAEVPYLSKPGLGDIKMYNAMDLKANGMGNHEFDGGINEFAHMLNAANYPFVAVNLNFHNVELEPGTPEIEIGMDWHRAKQNSGKVVRSTWIKIGSERIGVIGRAPADFFNVIKDPDTTLPGLDFYGGRDPETNQPLESAVDQVLAEVEYLERMNINKIILIDHAQDFTGDPLSAKLLRGIDIIVAAGSTGFMAKENADGPFNLLRPEDTAGADYPTVRDDSEGKSILVVNSDQQYRYVGNLMATFDKHGNIVEVDDRSGPIATTAEAIDAFEGVLGMPLSPHDDVATIFADLQSTDLIEDLFTVVGTTTGALNGNRADVRSRETNLGRLAANSTLWYANDVFGQNADIALKNGGGIRDTILGPNITKLTISAALAFDNKIAILRMTAGQVIAAMENSVSRVPSLDGRFPQVAGMKIEYDATLPGVEGQTTLNTPSRIKTLVITRFNGTTDILIDNFIAQGDLSRTFIMATNDFLSTGGDGYASLAAANKLVTSTIGEQQILADYIQNSLGGLVDIQDPPADSRVVRLD
jgi:2',3'-cyclic-nucleotide 2'-phosphodiesterase (5'-nucleotidase family)